MKKALEVMHYLEALNSDTQQQKVQTITELKEAISEAEKKEPDAWIITFEKQNGDRETCAMMGRYKDVEASCDFGKPIPLYKHPPTVQPKQQEWVGLTPDDIRLLEKENTVEGYHGDYCPAWDLIEAVEARLKEKNTKPLNWGEEKNSLTQKVSNEACTSVDAREEFGFAPMSLKGSNYKVRGF
jgi:hypothetical protein